MSDPVDEAWSSEGLIELQCLYRETRNPSYAWQAFLDFCPADKPLPPWIRDYLRGCAAAWLTEEQPAWSWPAPDYGSAKPGHLGLLDLFDAVRDGKLHPNKAARAVPRALGLTGPNGNAFEAHRELHRQAAVVAHYERFRSKGASDSELQIIGKNLAKMLGKKKPVSRSTLKRWIRDWRRLWEAQRQAKGASAHRGK